MASDSILPAVLTRADGLEKAQRILSDRPEPHVATALHPRADERLAYVS